MFNFIRRYFSQKKKPIENFSTTLTNATEGVKSRKALSPEIDEIVKRLRKNEEIDSADLNKIASFYFNTPTIEPGVYNGTKSTFNAMCFDITGVNAIYNAEGDIENIFLNLKEIAFNFDMVITVSVKDFHEIFTCLHFNPVTS